MSIETIFECMANWEYIWYAVLAVYILTSEIIYCLLCKNHEYADGNETSWIFVKIYSFWIGCYVATFLFMLIPYLIALVIFIINEPLSFLKYTGIVIGIILGIFLFFYSNYRLYGRYN